MDDLTSFLQQWEAGLDPRHPDNANPPARILGYGEISTVLEIKHAALHGYTIKRMPMFRNKDEVNAYITLHQEYLDLLSRAGIAVPETKPIWFQRKQGNYAVYMLQRKLDPASIGNKVLHKVELEDGLRLIKSAVEEMSKVFRFNLEHKGRLEIGFDGQISNWAVQNLSTDAKGLPKDIRLLYFDTTTPLIRKEGEEQINTELFLRSAPSFLVWIIRLLFLEDVVTRYYDFRLVIVDLIANLYKEKKAEWIPALVEAANEWKREMPEIRGKDFTEKEIKSYYREDAFIWRFYLAARKVDRTLHLLSGKEYPYILPDKIER